MSTVPECWRDGVPMPQVVKVDAPVVQTVQAQIQEEIVEMFQVPPQERTSERTVEHFVGVTVPQILNEIVEVVKAVKNVPQERISEGICDQIVDALVSHSQPQILKEVAEVVKAVKNVPQEHISENIGEQIDDDIVPVDQPGDQARRDPQACGDATTGPSDSDGFEDCESHADAVHRQSCRYACSDATTGPSTVAHPGDRACRGSAGSVHRQRCCRDACGDAERGPSDSDSIEDSGNPAGEVRRQNCGCAGTVTGDDSSEESDCGTDRSSIFDGLMAKLRQESS